MFWGKWIEDQVVCYILIIIAGVGILTTLIGRAISGKLLKEAQNIHHSGHPFMKLVKAKYEHANLVAERVQNVDAFVDKHLFEYRVLGIKCYTWQRMEIKWMLLLVVLGGLFAGVSYLKNGYSQQVIHILVWAAIGGALLFLVRILGDGKRRMEAIRNYIVDYLQNVCAHRYAKLELEKEPEEQKQEKPASEIRIREILEEFLA